MIVRIKIDPERLMSIIYALRTEKQCIFQGTKTDGNVTVPVEGSIVAAHPETSSFSVFIPDEGEARVS